MTALPIQHKNKYYIVPSNQFFDVFAKWPEHEQKKLTEFFGNNIPDVSMNVTVGEKNTPAKLRFQTYDGKLTPILNEQDVRYLKEHTSVAFYYRAVKLDWGNDRLSDYLDLERCFPKIHLYAVPEPAMADLIAEVRAIKDLIIEAMAKIEWQKDVKRQEKDELGALD